jgi:hypothetical protein
LDRGEPVARLLLDEMRRLGWSRVDVDDAAGRIRLGVG